MTGSHPKIWPTWLPWTEFWSNTNYNASSKVTSFKDLYGRDPPLVLKGITIPSKVASVNQLQEERDTVLKDLKYNLCRAQEQTKLQANKHREICYLSSG